MKYVKTLWIKIKNFLFLKKTTQFKSFFKKKKKIKTNLMYKGQASTDRNNWGYSTVYSTLYRYKSSAKDFTPSLYFD